MRLERQGQSMAGDLDLDRYIGRYREAGRDDRDVVTRAMFEGVVAHVCADRAALAAILPAPLELASAADQHQHPLIMIIGEQTRGASLYGGRVFEWGTRYHELIVVIPFVALRRSRRLCNFSPAMVTGYDLPTLIGNISYGYPKRLGRYGEFGERGSIRTFSTAEDGLVFECHTQPGSEAPEWQEAAAQPGLEAMVRVIAQPWIGRKPSGSFVRSHSRWSLDGARARAVVPKAVLSGSLLGTGTPLVMDPMPGGGFEVEDLRWELDWPREVVL